jgi:hypothetical protein
MKIDIKYKVSIYGPDPEDSEKNKLLFRNKLKRAIIETEDLDMVSEYHDKKGKKSKTRCEVNHRTLGTIIVESPFELIASYVRDHRFVVKGFVQYKNKKNGK